ncbi:MAG: response regulator transcription factor [Chloroflexi bacterium]|nr:response regulator transcription factor [Chloroflexota bacterium]
MEYQVNVQEYPTIRVLIADNHSLTRQYIKMFLQQANDIEIVGEAVDGQEALQLIEHLAPNVLIMDITLPPMNGLRITEQICRQGLNTHVVILSRRYDEAQQRQALRHGANGFVPKDLIAAELLSAVRAAHHDRIYRGCYPGSAR